MTRPAAAVAALALALAAACGTPGPANGRTIVIGLSSSPTNLDPGVGLDEASQRVHQLIYSSLLTFDDHLRIVPDLATRFDTTDWQTYVAAIPPGVRFQNGQEMTSADVAFTFRRFFNPSFASGKRGAFHDLTSVEIVDRYTVAFHLGAPSASFPSNLTNMGIVPDGSGADLARHPMGSGPYRIGEFVPDDHVTLQAFDGYYRGRPANDRLVLRVIPDDTMRGLELRKGDIDLVVNDLAPDIVAGLEGDPDLAVTSAPGTDYAYIGLNLRDRALADRRVRQAIGYAIDPEAITAYLRRGEAAPASGIIPPMSWAYASDLFRFVHDPAKAMALLDEAGYPDPDGPGPKPRLHLSLETSTSDVYRQQATVLQQQLGAVGIDIEIRTFEFATFFADVVRGNVQMYTLIFTGGGPADPDILRRVFQSSQTPPDGFNRGHYANPEVDRLLDLATRAVTEEDRRRNYVAAQRLIAEDAPLVSLWVRRNIIVARRDLTGIALSPLGDFDFLRHVARRP